MAEVYKLAVALTLVEMVVMFLTPAEVHKLAVALTLVGILWLKRVFALLPFLLVVDPNNRFNSNDFKNSAADVLRKFVVVILPGTSFLYLFSFIGKLHVFAMV
jgi:hypothetical protein